MTPGWNLVNQEIIDERTLSISEHTILRETTGSNNTESEFRQVVAWDSAFGVSSTPYWGTGGTMSGNGYGARHANGSATFGSLSVDVYCDAASGEPAVPHPTSVTATIAATLPVVWCIETWEYYEIDGITVRQYPLDARPTGPPLRQIRFRMFVDTRAGKEYSASVSVNIAGGDSDSQSITESTALGFNGDEDDHTLYALNIEATLAGHVTEGGACRQCIDWDDGIVMLQWNSNLNYAFGDSPFSYTWGPIHVACDTNYLTATSIGGVAPWGDPPTETGRIDAWTTLRSAPISASGQFHMGSVAYPGTLQIQDLTPTLQNSGYPDYTPYPARDISTGASFSESGFPLGAYYYQTSPLYPDDFIYYPAAGAAHWDGGNTCAWYRMKASFLTDNDHPSDDYRIMLRDAESRWPTILTLTMDASNEIEDFAAIGDWLDVANTTLSIVSGTLQAVVSGGAGSFQNAAADYKIRFRRLLEVSVKGPAGDITLELIDATMGTKTWTLTLAGTGSQEVILVDLMRPNEGPFEGPNLPRHTSHDGGHNAVYVDYTVKFSGLADEGTYQFAYLKETRDTTDGDHPATALVRMPAAWMPDYVIGLYTYYLLRNLLIFSQGLGSPANWWKDGIPTVSVPSGASREDHAGVVARMHESDPVTYAFLSVATWLTDLDALLSDAGFTVTPGNTSATGDVYANAHLLAAWVLEQSGVNCKTAQTFKAAVQGDAVFVQPGFPAEYVIKFRRYFGTQFCGATLTDAGVGNRGTSGVVLVAKTALHADSTTWTTDSRGAHLGPALGLPTPIPGWDWAIHKASGGAAIVTRAGMERAFVKAVGTALPDTGGDTTDLDVSRDSRQYLAWSDGTNVYLRWRSAASLAWTNNEIGTGTKPSVYANDTHHLAAVYVAYENGADVALRHTLDSGETWSGIVSIFTGASCPHIRKDKASGISLAFAWKAAADGTIVMRRSCDDFANFLEAEYTVVTNVPEQTVSCSFQGDSLGTYLLSFADATGAVQVYKSVDNGLTWVTI